MAEEGTATEQVADEDLSQAWDSSTGKTQEKAKEPEVTEEPEKEPEPKVETPAQPAEEAAITATDDTPEVLDHKEASKLGRKYKGLESKVDQILARLEQAAPKTEEQEIEVPEVISTPEDIDRYLAAKSQKAQRDNAEYEQGYLKQIQSLEKDNEDMHEEVFAEMMANHNVRHSNTPATDARINYAEAKAAVLKKKLSSPIVKVPPRETSLKAPAQPAASTTRSASKVATLPKLDGEAAAYVAHLKRNGVADEEIQAMLED